MKDEIVKFEIDQNKPQRIQQSNDLISSTYQTTLTEKRILAIMISMIKPEHDSFKEYRIDINKFAKIFNIKGDSIVELVKKSTKSLLSRTIQINDGNRFLQTNWISSAEYQKGSSDVIVTFDPKLKPYLLNLSSSYTTVLLDQVSNFKSVYAFRLYELFKQFAPNIKFRRFEVDSLQKLLGCGDKYPHYANFKEKAINRAVYEINNLTDLFVTFLEKKEGKRVKEIIFNIQQKSQSVINAKQEIKENETLNQDLIDLSLSQGVFISLQEVKTFFTKNNYKSSPEDFWNYWQARNWMDGKTKIINQHASAKNWENKFKTMNPILYYEEKLIKEPKEITALRNNLKNSCSSRLDYDLAFAGLKIEKFGDGFKILCNDVERKRIEPKHLEILTKFNITLA